MDACPRSAAARAVRIVVRDRPGGGHTDAATGARGRLRLTHTIEPGATRSMPDVSARHHRCARPSRGYGTRQTETRIVPRPTPIEAFEDNISDAEQLLGL